MRVPSDWTGLCDQTNRCNNKPVTASGAETIMEIRFEAWEKLLALDNSFESLLVHLKYQQFESKTYLVL